MTELSANSNLISKQSTHTKLCHLAHGRCEWKLSNPWVDKRNLQRTFLSHFTWLTPETNRQNLRFTQPSCFAQLHQEPKEELIYHVDNANHVTNCQADACKSWMARCFPCALGFSLHPALDNKDNLFLSFRFYIVCISEAVIRSSVKKLVLNISQNSKLFPLAKVFSVNFAKFWGTTFSTEHPQ